jgi:hypothetical protein
MKTALAVPPNWTSVHSALPHLTVLPSALTGSLDTDQILNLTANELLKGLGVRRVSVVTFERGRLYWKITTPRTSIKLPQASCPMHPSLAACANRLAFSTPMMSAMNLTLPT